MNKRPTDVSSYIAAANPTAQPMLKQLRAAIKSAAPKAEEKISYAMPYYVYHGRLIYFAAFTKHVGVYIMGGSRMVLPAILKKYRTAKATLQFPIGTKIPVAAIKTIVKAQMKDNEKMTKLKKR